MARTGVVCLVVVGGGGGTTSRAEERETGETRRPVYIPDSSSGGNTLVHGPKRSLWVTTWSLLQLQC